MTASRFFVSDWTSVSIKRFQAPSVVPRLLNSNFNLSENERHNFAFNFPHETYQIECERTQSVMNHLDFPKDINLTSNSPLFVQNENLEVFAA